jgi:hypothetical protein
MRAIDVVETITVAASSDFPTAAITLFTRIPRFIRNTLLTVDNISR